ncbi:MAG: ABC transporter ATP-binding protein, partial [Thermoleophilia bacterium]|nr:ABC transporter ATP-binding protein [Gaiellaceae bacterium]MDW8339777.1 ABC transporter ATP-binding protein [Thermoleophilia bacterium]
MTEPRALLATRGVERRFGRRTALLPTDLELRAGELVALVGPNGAGKSTLLAVLAGAIRPTAGRIEVATPPPRVGWAPQRPALYGHLSAFENLRLFARLARLEHPEEAAKEMLDLMDLRARPQPAAELSVGNQQRLNLALGLLGEPDVLLLDEPTASLDPPRRRRLWELVVERCAGGGAVLVATHVLEEVAERAARVVLLVDGRIVLAGGPGEVA